jgi:type III pantothenate kinase
LAALHDAAALLPEVEVARPDRVIGTDTVGAMQSGIYWGYVSLIEGLIKRIRAEYGSPPEAWHRCWRRAPMPSMRPNQI